MRTKEKLIEKILHIEDEEVLEEIMKMVDLELGLSGEIINLSEDQKEYIQEGLDDVEAGRVISDEDTKRIVAEWLSKK
jgi:hypothetical protein